METPQQHFSARFLKGVRPEYKYYKSLAIVPASEFSSLRPDQIAQTSKAFLEHIPSASRILDATAHVGCDTLNFARLYPQAEITAVEVDGDAYRCLSMNVRGNSRIRALMSDSAMLLQEEKAEQFDFVYFDPPWGGADYYKSRRLDLELGGQPIALVVEGALKSSPRVVLKAPSNFDFEKFRKALRSRTITIESIMKPAKGRSAPAHVAYNLLFVK